MSVTVTGDGPNIELTGTGSDITITVTTGSGGGGGGVTDHGLLTGLGDDDHTQYAKKASNLADLTDAATARTNLGLGSAATQASTAFDAAGTAAGLVDDLSGVSNASQARTNLGLGSAATQPSTAFAAASHTHAAADVTSGTMATARLGSGTANSTTFLRGDQTWATPAGGGDLTHVASVGAQTQITEAATGFGTPGTNATVLDSAITLPACAAGDVIQFVAGITYTNSSGSTRAPRPGFRLGSTNVTIGSLVAAGAVANGTTCSFIVRGTIHVLTTTSQELIVEVLGDGTTTSSQGSRTAATVDMSGTSSLQVTFGTNNASGTQTARLLSAHVTKVTA